MGGHPYWHFVKHRDDVTDALRELRQTEFAAGRFYPAVAFPSLPRLITAVIPKRKFSTIDAAREAAGETGTRSILDIDRIGLRPEYHSACPVSEKELRQLYNTTQPTRAAVEDNMDFLENIQRGMAVYFRVYKDGKPSEILFAGYSFD